MTAAQCIDREVELIQQMQSLETQFKAKMSELWEEYDRAQAERHVVCEWEFREFDRTHGMEIAACAN